MLRDLIRLAAISAAALLFCTALPAPRTVDAQDAAVGATARTAEVWGAWARRRSESCGRARHAGSAVAPFNVQRLGATFQINPSANPENPQELLLSDPTRQEPGRVAVFVDFRGVGDDIGGERNKDEAGFTPSAS